jgi:hypothetical protein
MKTLRMKLESEDKDELMLGLAGLKLSHGDFAVLLRRYTALKSKPDIQQLLKDLKWEASFREEESRVGGEFSGGGIEAHRIPGERMKKNPIDLAVEGQ